MPSIAFIDTEINPQSGRALDFGGVRDNGNMLHDASPVAFSDFIRGATFICGHNILNHDVKHIGPLLQQAGVAADNIIDTLYLSPLLFPSKPYHALVKDEKLQYDEPNNPLNDAIKAKDLFYNEIATFKQLDGSIQDIYFLLLKNDRHFGAFFKFVNFSPIRVDVISLIR